MKGYLSILLFLVMACESRVPSRSRLEQVCGIRLPEKFDVLKDDYREVGKDYCIVYELEFDSGAAISFAQKIKASPHYQHDAGPGSGARVWFNSGQGYAFRHDDGHKDFTIDFDTVTRKLEYSECAK
jgi:hypothetical protein